MENGTIDPFEFVSINFLRRFRVKISLRVSFVLHDYFICYYGKINIKKERSWKEILNIDKFLLARTIRNNRSI